MQENEDIKNILNQIIDKIIIIDEKNIINNEKSKDISKNTELLEKIDEQKNYNKLLFEHLKEFIENIDENLKNKNLIIKKLYKNVKNIKKELYEFKSNLHKNILLIDGENILKSLKIHNLFKNKINEEEFQKYFYKWYYGSTADDDNHNDLFSNDSEKINSNFRDNFSNNSRFSKRDNFSINSRFSNKDNFSNYKEPFKTLDISLEDKMKLINILILSYLQNYNIIYTVNSKFNNIIKKNYTINNSKILVIPIIYDNNNDIREQDDHLLLFIDFHLKKLIDKYKIKLITNDKFKWYTKNIDIYNFIFYYDFDKIDIFLKIKNSYTNDVICYKNTEYILDFYNSPIISMNSFKYVSIDNINFSRINIKKCINISLNILLHVLDRQNNIFLENSFVDLINNHIQNMIVYCKQYEKDITNIINSIPEILKKIL